MQSAPPELTEAFEGFARASASLETSYAALRARVEELSFRLADTESRLARSLDENRRLHDAAARRSRLEAMGRMAAEIAHEIRNPLGGLELTACLLRDELAEQEGPKELAESVVDGIRSLTRVTGGLLTFTRSIHPRPRRLGSRAFLARVQAFVAPACAARGVELVVPRGEDVAFVGDPELLQQILLNLVQNALEALPAEGRIVVDARATGAGELEFRVSDDGEGMDAEVLSRVFDPFFTTRERGTGLGLSISFRLAEAQGASIELHSEPGRGTTATVRFRLDEPASGRGLE